MTAVAEEIRANYNNLIDNDPATDYGIKITSGFRNPERNEKVSTTITSLHQFARAIDIRPVQNVPNKTWVDLINLVVQAANPVPEETNVICENGNGEILCDGSQTIDHVHVEFR